MIKNKCILIPRHYATLRSIGTILDNHVLYDIYYANDAVECNLFIEIWIDEKSCVMSKELHKSTVEDNRNVSLRFSED